MMEFIKKYKAFILVFVIGFLTVLIVSFSLSKLEKIDKSEPGVIFRDNAGQERNIADVKGYDPKSSCPIESKTCSDGSLVARTGIDCEFAECPYDASIKVKLADCLPKSDMLSKDLCDRILKFITTYKECVDAGFSIMKSNPEQCATPDGRTFVNLIPIK